jgi:hypothetical protein
LPFYRNFANTDTLMNFKIVEINKLTGRKCKIYTIIFDDGSTLFDQFMKHNQTKYPKEVEDIVARIKIMADLFGAREDYFKINYGNPGDGVSALFDGENKKLRLMCIRFPNVAILLGGGGPKEVRAYQEDKYLNEKANEMKKISSLIIERLRNKEIIWSKDGTTLEGDLNFNFD